MLSMKNLVFKKILVKKLVDQYVGPYFINKIVSANIVKLQLLTSMRIHLVVKNSQIVCYKEQVKKQRIEKVKLVKVKEVKEQKVEKITFERKRKTQRIQRIQQQNPRGG